MEIIDIGVSNDLEPITLRMDDEIKPSVNFGPGIELLMNDRKRSNSSSTNVDLGELDKLETELNELTGNAPSTSTSAAGTKSISGLFDFAGIKNPFSSGSSSNAVEEPTDSNLGQATKESVGSSRTWDGFGKINEVPNERADTSRMSDREKRRKKRAMLKKLDEWYTKGSMKNMTQFNMDSAYEDIEDEYETVMEDKRKKDSVKLQGWWFMTFINSIEYANTVFNPFDLNLDGWGEQVNEDIDSYEEIFSELHEKYKGGKLSPEISLLLRLGFSAAVVNITNKALSTATPGFNDVIRQSPELMRMFTNATVQSMSQQSPGFGFANNMANPMDPVNTSRGPPPPPVETKNQPPPPRAGSQMNFTQAPSNRPDISAGRGAMFREPGIEMQSQAPAQQPRPEMRGPQNLDFNGMLSGLKTREVELPQMTAENDSLVSVTSLRDLQNTAMPKRSKPRKPRSERNTISLDI